MKNQFFTGKVCVILLTVLFSGPSFSQGINFEHDTTLAAVKAKARAANKLIFIDCYTTWCGPCQWVARNIFPNDSVGQFFNEHFVSVKMDMEKGDGKNIASAYNVKSYPSYLFLDTSGKVVHRFVGTMKASKFIARAEEALDTLNRLGTLKKRYQNGDRDPAFLRQYIYSARRAREPNVTEIVDWYFTSLPEDELLTTESFDVIQSFIFEMHRPGFEKLYRHREKYIALVGSKKVNDKILYAALTKFNEAFKQEPGSKITEVDEKKYTEALAAVGALDFEGREALLSQQNVRYLKFSGDQNSYMNALKEYIPQYSWDKSQELNYHAWNVYESTDKKEYLELALTWARRSVELKENCYNIDTYAAICQKLGHKKEALEYAEKALELAKNAKVDIKVYIERLDAIRKM